MTYVQISYVACCSRIRYFHSIRAFMNTSHTVQCCVAWEFLFLDRTNRLHRNTEVHKLRREICHSGFTVSFDEDGILQLGLSPA